MSSLELLNAYLKRLEARFRLAALARGAAVTAASALAATVLIVLASNWLAFSEQSLTAGRVVLFLCVAFALGFGLALPLTKLNLRRAARDAELRAPEFNQRLLTIAERQGEPGAQPFLELLAADTLQVAGQVSPSQVVRRPLLIGFSSAALAAVGTLLWLVFGAGGFLGYGARMLWAGPPRVAERQAFYDILITPGDRTVRRGGSQSVTAQLVGFEAPSVRLFARYQDSTKWEEAPMLPREGAASAYEFLFAGLPATVEYYVAAGRIRSKTYKITVVDVPNVKRLKVTYRYPSWTGLSSETEDPASGDLRAVEGTEAEITVETDRPLSSGELVLEDGTRVALESGSGNLRTARLKIQQDGVYHIAAMDRGESVRLTDDFFIDVQKDNPPLVRVTRPGRDARVLPIEEVTLAAEAADDFGLQEFNLHYSVNGGPEKVVPLLKQKGGREQEGSLLLALEDYKLVPGDVVAVYASARDARASVKTDIFFVEAQPYEREYTQSQQMGGGGMEGMEGGQQRQGQISQRQKEIIAATWNQLRDKSSDKKAIAENAQFLSDMQSKLREQAKSLATRMGRRELSEQNEEFQGFANDMEKAAEAMGEAAEHLKGARWQQAVAPEQKALQHLLRAEATYRQIQVAFGNRGQRGGQGGGGQQARDLENLFDLELDTEKNQYETGQQASTGSQREREIDEALQRLEQLARRQQELASQARQPQQMLQQRWQQELLRREAEQLQRQMEQLARSGSQGQPSRGQSGQSGQSQADSRLQQALDRLSRATEDMRRAASSQNGGQPQSQADSRRAAERLQEAQDILRGMRSQQAGEQVSDLARRAEQLAQAQQEYQNQLRQLFREQTLPDGRILPEGVTREQVERSRQMAAERERMQQELGRLSRDMQQASRNLAGTERAASSRLRSALGELQQNEIEERMRYNAELLRRGYGPYVIPRETPVTEGLNQLRDQLREAQRAVSGGRSPNQDNTQQALSQLERLRNQWRALGQDPSGRQGQQGDPRGANQQAGQQAGGQRGGQQQGGQRGGEQQQAGQQQGNQGGRQGGGQLGGGRQQGQQGRGQPFGDERAGNPQGARGLEGPLYRDGEWQLGRQGTGGDGWRRAAMNRGDYTVPPVPDRIRQLDPAEAERIYRESMRQLSELRQTLAGNPEASKEIQELIREMSRIDLSSLAENPLVMERIRAAILPNLEQIELQLRRQVEDKEGGQVRNPAAEPAPPGYTDAVAEYFRRLSRGK